MATTPVLDTRPQLVDITHYGSDTLTIEVTAPASLVSGKEWLAQIKTKKEDMVPSASFTITPPAVADGPAYLILPSAESARLLGLGTAVRERTSAGTMAVVQKYTGFWDCQVSATGGADPVTTLVQGKITIEIDVSRP